MGGPNTRSKLEAILARIDFTHFPIPIGFEVFGDAEIGLIAYFRDRADPLRLTRVVRRLRPVEGADEMWIAALLHREVVELIRHEIDECFLFDRIPVRRPHPERSEPMLVLAPIHPEDR